MREQLNPDAEQLFWGQTNCVQGSFVLLSAAAVESISEMLLMLAVQIEKTYSSIIVVLHDEHIADSTSSENYIKQLLKSSAAVSWLKSVWYNESEKVWMSY